MEKIQRAVRFLVIILLIILATIGIGITGVAPTLPQHRKNSDNVVKIELVEDKERKKKSNQTAEIR